MYSVMIVDDEPLIRAGLKSAVNWENAGFYITEEARNGIDALSKIQLKPADLVITDIRMPKMDGIELLKNLKENGLCDCVVFLSGFSDFTYAKQGLVLGAFDYILKPMDPEKIAEVLKRAYEYIKAKRDEEEEHKRLTEKLQFNISVSREKILTDMLKGKMLPFESFDYVTSEYDIELMDKTVQASIIEIDEYDLKREESWKRNIDEELIDRLKEKTAAIINLYSKLTYVTLDGDIGSINLILQPKEEMEITDFEGYCGNLYSQVLDEIYSTLDIRVTIGIGRAYDRISHISSSYLEAREALRHRYVIGSNRVISIRQLEIGKSRTFPYPIEKEKLLISYLMLGDDKAERVVEEVFNEICENSGNELYSIGMAITKMTAVISKVIEEKFNYLTKVRELRQALNVTFENYTSIYEISKSFSEMIRNILTMVKDLKLNHRDNIINKACEYVVSHIDEDITLSKVADYLCISKNYFCALFKQETGENFLEYVTRLKMERAKIMLKQGNYKAYEVCEKLGYQETGYFSRLFKRYTGYSPTEYRKHAEA